MHSVSQCLWISGKEFTFVDFKGQGSAGRDRKGWPCTEQCPIQLCGFLWCAVLILGLENMDTKWLKDVLPYVSDSRLSPANKSRQHSNSSL